MHRGDRLPTCPLTPNADASTDLKIIRSLIHELLQGEQPAAIESALVVLYVHRSCAIASRPLGEHFRSLLEADFGVPVSVDNDNVAASGSIALALDRMTVYVHHRQHWRRWWLDSERTPLAWCRGMAGEIGHIADPAGPLCLCGKRGCVERLASGPHCPTGTRCLQHSPEGTSTVLWLATTWRRSLVR